MIIFYDKNDGKITGTIEGRVHSPIQLNMWIGDQETTDRLIISWKIVGYLDSEGNPIEDIEEFKLNKEPFRAVYKPDIEDENQISIIEKLDKREDNISNYVVDPTTKLLKLQ